MPADRHKAQAPSKGTSKGASTGGGLRVPGTPTGSRHSFRYRRASVQPQVQVPPRDEACVRYKIRWKRALEPGAKSTNAKGHRDIGHQEATGTSAAHHGLVTAHSAAAAEVRQPLYCNRFHYKQSSRFNCARARTLGGASSPMGIGLVPCEPPVLWLSRGQRMDLDVLLLLLLSRCMHMTCRCC